MLEAEQQDTASVETVAHLVKQMNYNNKDMLVGALVIAGYDDQQGGQVYGCPIGGTLSKEKWAIDGSGSTFIWGYCDATYRCGGGGGRGRLCTHMLVHVRLCVCVCTHTHVWMGGCDVCDYAGFCAIAI